MRSQRQEKKYVTKGSMPDILESVTNYNRMEGINKVREIMRSRRMGPYLVLYMQTTTIFASSPEVHSPTLITHLTIPLGCLTGHVYA